MAYRLSRGRGHDGMHVALGLFLVICVCLSCSAFFATSRRDHDTDSKHVADSLTQNSKDRGDGPHSLYSKLRGRQHIVHAELPKPAQLPHRVAFSRDSHGSLHHEQFSGNAMKQAKREPLDLAVDDDAILLNGIFESAGELTERLFHTALPLSAKAMPVNYGRENELSHPIDGVNIDMLRGESVEIPHDVKAGTYGESRSWVTGVGLTALGTVVTAIGNLLVGAAARLEQQRSRITTELVEAAAVRRRLRQRSRIFLIVGNFNIIVLGTLITMVSFAYAAQSLLAPLSGLTIVWNALLAPYFGTAALSRRDVSATFVTLLGSIVIVASGPKASHNFLLGDLIKLFSRPAFQVYSAIMVAASLALFLVATGRVSISAVGEVRFAHAALAGVLGGFSNVLAKAVVELLKDSFTTGWYGIVSALPRGVIVVGTLVTAGSQLYWLNRALARYDALVVVPTYQAVLLLASTISGAIYYGDFDELSTVQWGGFTIGVISVCAGVVVLSQTTKTAKTAKA